VLTTLYSFCSQVFEGICTDGNYPTAGLIQGPDGDLYGTTSDGGLSAGTVFKITTSGTLTKLYDFCSIDRGGCLDGWRPNTALVQASDGNFYGTTDAGGASNYGTIFKITQGGTLTTLHNFCSFQCVQGNSPFSLMQATNGNFYGTAAGGAHANDGVLFRLSVDLGPFVETLPTSGRVGTAVRILGNDLGGASSVTFNGTAAAFTVNSAGTAISTAVPGGATTGPVQVVTPGETLLSNVPFRVP
jgi:uncharacterized repeat protein (TIGR03803 family)